MLNDLDVILARPLMLLIILLIGSVIGILIERFTEQEKRAKRRAYWERKRQKRFGNNLSRSNWQQPKSVQEAQAPERVVPDAADQLRIVMEASFSARPLLNQPERRLLAHLDRALAEEAPSWRAMGQVSLGEILSSKDSDAFLAINSKRVDLLIIDEECRPLHAVEFQGTGHHLPGGGAAARDAVKKEALRKAGVGYVEIVSGNTPAELRDIVRKLAGRAGGQVPPLN